MTIRSILIGATAMIAFLSAASSAAATLSINPATTRLAATGAVSLIDSTGMTTQLTCLSSTITDTIRSDGGGSIPLGSALFSSCTLGVAVTQVSAWNSIETLHLSGGQITSFSFGMSIPFAGWRWRAALGCEFYPEGTQYATLSVPATTPPDQAAIGTLRGGHFGTNLSLRISRIVTNALCPQIALGDAVRIAAPYNLNPAISGTLI